MDVYNRLGNNLLLITAYEKLKRLYLKESFLFKSLLHVRFTWGGKRQQRIDWQIRKYCIEPAG